MNNEMAALYDEILDLKNEVKAMRAILIENDLLKTDKSVVVNHPKVEKLDVTISNILLNYQIKPHLKGYRYLREAIKMLYENGNLSGCITTILYPSIAEKFNDAPSRVERAIRHAIDRGFGRTIDRPTNTEFIAMIVEKLKLENRVESA